MKKTSFLVMLMVFGLTTGLYAQESVEITPADKELIARDLDKEAESPSHSEKVKKHLKKVADFFKQSSAKESEGDLQCEQKENKLKLFAKKLGMALGKGSAWVSTTTAKPFMTAAGFMKGLLEKEGKNKDVIALYQFFLNHEKEFDELYLEAGTPEEMAELMLAKMEEIMENKSKLIMSDFLKHLGVEKEIKDLSDLELTPEEIAQIDPSKIDVAFINNHPEYQEVRPLIGNMTEEQLMLLIDGKDLTQAISFENYKEHLPKPAEVVGTIVGQLFAPKIALGVVSKSLASIYGTTVLLADVGTGVSAAICLQEKTQDSFETDKELRAFCSYVTNRTAYQLLKGRVKGYVKGKEVKSKLNKKIEERRKRREERKRKQLELAPA